MSNTSKKRRNKKIRIGVIIGIIALLVISFVVSQNDKKVDPASIADVEVFPISAHIKGNAESDITLIEYSDFQCPACKAAAPAVGQLVDELGGQFALEYRHFPLRQIHPNAQLAAQASEAAGIQGKFWEMHDLLFEKQSEWATSLNPKRHFINYAGELGLNEDRFKLDLNSDEVKAQVNAHADEAAALGLPGTPAFVYNGEQIDIQDFVANVLGFVEPEVIEEAAE